MTKSKYTESFQMVVNDDSMLYTQSSLRSWFKTSENEAPLI